MRKFFAAATVLCVLVLVLAGSAFAQTGNGKVTGTISDVSKALLPGVTVRLTNTETGVVQSQVSNESGVYNFLSVPFGTKYQINATLPGFKTAVRSDVEVGLNATITVNITLEVGAIETSVDVTASSAGALLETGVSVGDVLTRDRIENLPLVGNNVLDLLDILPGIRLSAAGSAYSSIGGLGIDEINVTRDGITVSDTRFQAGQTEFFQRDTGAFGNPGGFIACPGGGFASGIALDPTRPCTTSYSGSTRQLSTTFLNPELVGEIRLILSPVDAELGRGNSQIQIQTRSGTNRYSGSASWNIRNTALNANSWNNNNNTTGGVWNPIRPDWRNTHQYTVSYGGPIIRNKTFFFVSWDQNLSNTRNNENALVLTDQARQGIFRYWEGYLPQNANSANNGSGLNTEPAVRSVDDLGNPLNPYPTIGGVPATSPVWRNNTAYTGRLVCISVFGNLKLDGTPFTSADCPSGVDNRGNPYTAVALFPPAGFTTWDPRRPASNPTGYIGKILERMPHANTFNLSGGSGGDGLNTAAFRWVRGRGGDASGSAVVGSSAFTNRKQINIKIDQNFLSHRISGNWTYQMDDSADNVASWPDGLSGTSIRRPQTLTMSGTSTLSPTLLNEARFGLNYNKQKSLPAWFVPNSDYQAEARDLLCGPNSAGCPLGAGERNGSPYSAVIDPSFFGADGAMSGGTGTVTNLSFENPSYTFADTVSWTKGAHAFKFGADVRLPRSDGYSLQQYPTVAYGNTGGAVTTNPFDVNSGASNSNGSQQYITELGCHAQNCSPYPIFTGNTRARARDLTYLLTDSIGTMQSFYWVDSQADLDNAFWQDATTQDNRIRQMRSAEYAFFVKDDYRVRRDLTLNLGIRYEYNSPAYLASGLTSTIAEQGNGLFGVGRSPAAGGDLFNNWLHPGNLFFAGYGNNGGLRCEAGTANLGGLPASTCDPAYQTAVEFVGPNTTNPGKTVLPRDRNNFGPAVGFSWQLPWFGAGKTTIRGGYSIQFSRVNVSEGQLASALGTFSQPTGQSTAFTDARAAIVGTSTAPGRAVVISDLPVLIPANVPTSDPGQTIPVYTRSQSITSYSPDFVSPYTQNLNLSVTRSVTRNITLDLRYVGTLARKQNGQLNLNTSTALYNEELFAAFDAARRGENPALLDQMLMGLRLPGVPTSYGTTAGNVNGVNSFGGGQLRMSSATRTALANGDYDGLASTLMGSSTGALSGTNGLQTTGQPSNAVGVILRNGCNRIANGVTTVGTGGGTISNVQTRCFAENYLIANPQLNGGLYNANLGHNNYHGLQVAFNMRATQGISFNSTYSWAKSLGVPGSGFTDPLNRGFDYSAGGGNLLRTEPKHTFRMNGTFELPIGPNKLFFGNTSGWIARAIERWSTSIILNLQSGSYYTIGGAQAMRYDNGLYTATNQWVVPQGHVKFGDGESTNYFGENTFFDATDPQCFDSAVISQVADVAGQTPLSGRCTLNALGMVVPQNTPGAFPITNGFGTFVLVNPRPGNYGTVGRGLIEGYGSWTMNANIGKTFRLTENKQLTIRMDATNVLNHPTPNPITTNVGPGADFGEINGKGGSARNFQGSLRLTF